MCVCVCRCEIMQYEKLLRTKLPSNTHTISNNKPLMKQKTNFFFFYLFFSIKNSKAKTPKLYGSFYF